MMMAKNSTATTPQSNWKPYPSYKDSGAEWLGKIPAHWEVRRLKNIASVELSNVDKKSVEGQDSVRLCNYVDVYNNERITADLDFMAATATPEQARRFALRNGDVLITKDSESWTDIAVPAVVSEDLPGVICGYHLAHVRPYKQCNGAFLSRAFAAIGPRDQFQVAANGITRFGLGSDAIRTGLFPIPPRNEQSLIAAFLDRETQKIDALMAKKERLIELLQEKRVALITRAVTKGLDPTVPMKDPGVEWLGQIPVHWEVKRLKFLASEITVGIVVTPAKYYVDSGIPCLRSLNIASGHIVSEDMMYISEESNRLHKKSRLRAGDVIIVRTGLAGTAAIVTEEFDGSNCVDLLIIRKSKRLVPQFLYYFINSDAAAGQVQAHSVGAIQAHYNTATLGDLMALAPPLKEQERIVAFLNAETAKLDDLIAKVLEGIEKLKEYRTALISTAVTGKIDVREAV